MRGDFGRGRETGDRELAAQVQIMLTRLGTYSVGLELLAGQ
jgi:hypothetical protein